VAAPVLADVVLAGIFSKKEKKKTKTYINYK